MSLLQRSWRRLGPITLTSIATSTLIACLVAPDYYDVLLEPFHPLLEPALPHGAAIFVASVVTTTAVVFLLVPGAFFLWELVTGNLPKKAATKPKTTQTKPKPWVPFWERQAFLIILLLLAPLIVTIVTILTDAANGYYYVTATFLFALVISMLQRRS